MKEHDVSFLLLLLNNFPQLSRIKIPQRFEAWALKQFWWGVGGECSILFLLILFIVLDLNKFNLYLDPKGEFVYILLIELKNKPS